MIPLFTSEQIREADTYAAGELGIPGIVLMENASKNFYDQLILNFPDLDRYSPIGIIAGRGNNGGDGFAAARHLVNNGFKVKVLALGDKKDLSGDALLNFSVLQKLSSKIKEISIRKYKSLPDISWLNDCQLIIDAMLGTGAKGELREPYLSIVERVNRMNCFKAAIDIPTGLNTDNASGVTVFRSDLTVSLGELKRGLFYGEGYVSGGKIVKGGIGIGDEFFDGLAVNDYLLEPEDALAGLPFKRLDLHKYTAGKVFVIAGSGRLPGAAILTASSALRGGAGAVVLAFPRSIKSLAQSMLKSAVVYPYEDDSDEILKSENLSGLRDKLKWADVVAIGPGLGREPETVEAVLSIIREFKSKKFVIDADAVYALNGGHHKKLDLRGKVLTPHHKEFADLIGVDLEYLKLNLLPLGKEFSTSTGAYLVLKGAPTIIFNPGGEALINSAGNPGLAKFGSGDVLTGLAASFLAQSDEIENALTASVYIHSLDADLLLDHKTEMGINAEDLIDNIPSTIKFLRNSFVQSV